MLMPRRNVLFGSPKSAQYRYFFYGPVGGPENYIDLINLLDSCSEGDEIHFMINTLGGRLDTTISIVHAMNRTNAHVVCHADGDVASAGSIIFFSGHSWVVNPYSTFMLHDGTGGNVGKIGQNVKAAVSVQENLDFLYRNVYKDFFTEEEIDQILNGSDHYSNSEDIVERVQRVMEEQKSESSTSENVSAVLEALGVDKEKVASVIDIIKDDDTEDEGSKTLDDSAYLEGFRVRVNDPKLANHGNVGTVVEDGGFEKVKVKMDHGPTIKISVDKLEDE